MSMIREQRAFFRQIVSLCKPEHLATALQLSDSALRAMVLELYQALGDQRALASAYQSMHAEGETDQLNLLRTLA